MEPKHGEPLVESWVEQPAKLEVDREKRLVRNVVLLGEHSQNGYDYDRGAMKSKSSARARRLKQDRHGDCRGSIASNRILGNAR